MTGGAGGCRRAIFTKNGKVAEFCKGFGLGLAMAERPLAVAAVDLGAAGQTAREFFQKVNREVFYATSHTS